MKIKKVIFEKFSMPELKSFDDFMNKIFCLFGDIEKIKKLGLAQGGSLENAVVVNDKNF